MSEQGADDVSPKGSQYLLHLYRGSDFLLKEQVVEARQELEEASRIDPEDPKGLSLLGLVYFRLDEYERAQQIYELLVARYPEEAPLRVNLGLVYMKQGRAGAAQDEMNRAVAIDPNHQRAYGYLGLLYSEAGDHERARVAFAKAGQDAMVQRMDELLAERPRAVETAAGQAVRQPADTQKVWVAADAMSPGGQLASPPVPPPVAPPPIPSASPPVPSAPPPHSGSPQPVGSMTPMMSDAMTQPVAIPTFDPRAGHQAPWPAPESGSALTESEAAAPPTAPGEAEAAYPGAFDGAMQLKDTWDWVHQTTGTISPGAASPGEPAPAGAQAADPPLPDAQPQDAQPQDAQPQDVQPQDAQPQDAQPQDAQPTYAPPLDAQSPAVEAGSLIDAADVSDALDRAVGPAQPWPTGGRSSGVFSPSSEEPREEDGEHHPSRPPPPLDGLAEAPAPGGAEAMPIFAFATTGLVDLGARHERMTCSPEGLLLISVEEDGYFRAESLVAEVGDLRFEPAFRRTKGANTEEPMTDGRGRFLKARGEGLLLCSPGADQLVVLDLFDDFIYVRSEHLFAFESTLHWENGKIRGLLGAIPLIHVRGEGRLALACDPGLRKLRLVPDRPALVAESALVGWVGRVIPQTMPRPVGDEHNALGAPLLRCEGEGVLLVLPQRVASGSWRSVPGGEAG